MLCKSSYKYLTNWFHREWGRVEVVSVIIMLLWIDLIPRISIDHCAPLSWNTLRWWELWMGQSPLCPCCSTLCWVCFYSSKKYVELWSRVCHSSHNPPLIITKSFRMIHMRFSAFILWLLVQAPVLTPSNFHLNVCQYFKLVNRKTNI